MDNFLGLAAIREFTEILDQMNIPYAIGGSIASSLYGQVRFTQDADITVVSFQQRIPEFCQNVERSFYVSKETVTQAHRQKSSFNIIHFETAFKIDVFVSGQNPFQQQMMIRRKVVALQDDRSKPVKVVSPEDIILLKLQWFNQGGQVSEKQWNDILGVLKAQQDRLDYSYLREWSSKLSVWQLLQKALQQTKDQH